MPKLPIHQQITFFMVRDLEATASFYEGFLGLALALDQTSCRIYRVVGDAYVGFCERPEAADSTHPIILTWVTPEVDAWYARLVELGADLENEPAVNPAFKIYHFFVRDPDGYRVEFQQFLDPVMARLPRDASSSEVAAMHYRALAGDDRELWVLTLKALYREMADRRGSTPHTWWQAGRTMTGEHGVTYEFERVDQQDEERCKLFFKRLNADGSQRGQPVPIHLIREAGEWRVNIASY